MLFTGYAVDSGTLKALAAYVGWFLSAYSGIAYLIASLVLLSQGPQGGRGFWTTFYPANFGLALLALSVFGIHDAHTVLLMAAVAGVAAIVSYFISQSRILDKRGVPLIVLLLPLLVFIDAVFLFWKYILIAVGVFVLTCSLAAFIKARTSMDPVAPRGERP